MSLNLTLQARKGRRGRWKSIDLYQTPTDVTFELLKADDVFTAYCNWLPGRVTEYATGETHRRHCLKRAEEHIAEVSQWIEEMKATGHTVVFSYI